LQVRRSAYTVAGFMCSLELCFAVSCPLLNGGRDRYEIAVADGNR